MANYGCHFWQICYGEFIPNINNTIERLKVLVCARTFCTLLYFWILIWSYKKITPITSHLRKKKVIMHKNARFLRTKGARAIFLKIFFYNNLFCPKSGLLAKKWREYLEICDLEPPATKWESCTFPNFAFYSYPLQFSNCIKQDSDFVFLLDLTLANIEEDDLNIKS